MNLFEELKWRGLIKDVSNEELAKKFLNEEKVTFYCGFDPSAPSMTIGNFVQMVRIKLLQSHGHKPIVLLGGATGLIGDPGGTNKERNLLTIEESMDNAEKIKLQFENIIDFDGENKAIMVNNYDWISKINMIEFLRDYGKHFSINYMLAKDSVSSRLEGGISYTEFSYMILQAIDFLHLYKTYDCKLQFGGSDQWGNITAGLELIRRTHNEKCEVLALSSNLLLKADGTKFGKSESGALWLDPKKTSPYEIYQYLINTSDADVVNYLKTLTLLSPSEIMDLEEKVKISPHLREAQKVLARETIRLIHGDSAVASSLRITDALFNGDIKALSGVEIENAFKDVPSKMIEKEVSIIDLLALVEAASSKREAREFIVNGAITVNGEKVNDENYIVNPNNAIEKKYIVIRRGKKKYYLIKF